MATTLWEYIHQSGAWDNNWGDFEQKQLEIVNELIRLNPEDDDSKYKESFYDVDYAYEGGLYNFKFKHLKSVYFNDDKEGWSMTKEGQEAKKALMKACELHPDEADYMQVEAKYAGIIIS